MGCDFTCVSGCALVIRMCQGSPGSAERVQLWHPLTVALTGEAGNLPPGCLYRRCLGVDGERQGETSPASLFWAASGRIFSSDADSSTAKKKTHTHRKWRKVKKDEKKCLSWGGNTHFCNKYRVCFLKKTPKKTEEIRFQNQFNANMWFRVVRMAYSMNPNGSLQLPYVLMCTHTNERLQHFHIVHLLVPWRFPSPAWEHISS